MNVKLADFGISRVATFSGLRCPAGTPLYRAPEVIIQQPYSTLSDVYSAGATFYELMHGGRNYVHYRCPNGVNFERVIKEVCFFPFILGFSLLHGQFYILKLVTDKRSRL